MFESCMIGLFITEFMVFLTNHQLVILAHILVFSFACYYCNIASGVFFSISIFLFLFCFYEGMMSTDNDISALVNDAEGEPCNKGERDVDLALQAVSKLLDVTGDTFETVCSTVEGALSKDQ